MSDKPQTYKRWPLVNRIFHWSLVFGFCLMWWSGEYGFHRVHVYAGYGMAGLVAFRLVWGIIGPREGRLLHLISSPKTLWNYIKSLHPKRYVHARGHNPLGGLSVLAILSMLSAHLLTGLFAANQDGGPMGSLSRLVDYETSFRIAELHHKTFYALLTLVGLHLAALLFYAAYLRINLVGAMITGRKSVQAQANQVPSFPDDHTPDARLGAWRLWLAVLLAGLLVGFLYKF